MIEYICRIKWKFSREEYLSMTLREFVAFRDAENPEEPDAYADDLF